MFRLTHPLRCTFYRRNWLLGMALISALALPGISYAQEEGESVPAEEQTLVEQIQPPLEQRVREALTKAVVNFRERSRQDSDDFILPPARQRQVVDWKEVEVRYTKKMVDIPIYEYENYKTVGNIREGDSVAAGSKLGTVTKRRRKRQIGTREEERLVHDPNGEVVRTERRPIWGKGGPDLLYPGWWGQNGLVIYACLEVGVPVHDTQLSRNINILTDYLDGYRLPDRTWDLAWLTAAYVNLPKDNPEYKKLAQMMVNKLLLGQIEGGDAEGMWGPVCVNPELLGKMMAHEQDVYKNQLAPWEQKLKENPKRERYREKMEEAKGILNKFHLQFDLVTQQCLEFDHLGAHRVAVQPVQEATNRIEWLFREVHVRGLPFTIYGENLADMESTSIALFALAEARENGYLPEQTVPPVSVEGRPIIPPVTVETILQRALDAVAQRQTGAGTCTEKNYWFPVHSFDEIGIAGIPYDSQRFSGLDSSLTFASTAMANAALADGIRAAEGLSGGTSRFGSRGININKYWRQYGTSSRMAADMTQAILDGETRGLDIGYQAKPYGFLFQLTRATTAMPPDRQTLNRSIWVRYAEQIMPKQAEGIWGEKHEITLPSSVREYLPASYRKSHEIKQKSLPLNKRSEIEEKALNNFVNHRRNLYGRRIDREVTETAYAMIFLAGGIRPPMGGAWSWNGNVPRVDTLEKVMSVIEEENGAELVYSVLPPELPASELESLPVLFASGVGEFKPVSPDSLQRLKGYLDNGGRFVIEAPDNPDGNKFFETAKTALREVFPSLQEKTLPKIPELPDDMPDLTALVGSSGLVAVLLPVGNSPGSLTLEQEVAFVKMLLEKRVDPAYMQPGYAIDWAAVEEADQIRQEQEANAAADAFRKAAMGEE